MHIPYDRELPPLWVSQLKFAGVCLAIAIGVVSLIATMVLP
jgi:hypothetical protein